MFDRLKYGLGTLAIARTIDLVSTGDNIEVNRLNKNI